MISEFLWFLRQYESMDISYQRLVEEAKDLQRRLDEQMQQTIAIDRKLNYARKMLESERKARRLVETEKSQLVKMDKKDYTKKVGKRFIMILNFRKTNWTLYEPYC